MLLLAALALVAQSCSATHQPADPQDLEKVSGEPARDGGLEADGAPAEDGAGPARSGDPVPLETDGSSLDAGLEADSDLAPGADQKKELVEARGLWVTRWDFHSAEDVQAIMERVAQAGFNQVYFQVRGAADAYYRSSLEPWAAPLSGKLGRDPGWDPLHTAIVAAREQGLELHAWINVCTGWKGKTRPGRSKPRHMLRAHPDWRLRDRAGKPMPYTDGAYVFMNPAHPEFQKHLVGVVSEIASFYDIDGLHLDYARYPARDTSYDRVSNKRFKKARKEDKSLTRARWQREELARLIENLSSAARKVRPGLDVSAAVTGIYLDRWNWNDVTQGKLDFHQDSHLWAEKGAVDSLIPMIYWKPTTPKGKRTDFLTLAQDFAPLSAKVRLLAGVNVEAGGFEVLEREVVIAREQGFAGVVVFAYQTLTERGWLTRLKKGLFAQPARPRAVQP